MNTRNAEKLERQLKLAVAREVHAARQDPPAVPHVDALESAPVLIPEVQPGQATTVENSLSKPATPFRLRKILVPVDFSEPSENALAYATGFAGEFGARLVLMHVVSPITYSTPGMMPPQIMNLEDDLQRDAAEKLDRLKGSATGPENGQVPPPETYVCTGTADVEITRAAREMAADLIIMATRGFTGLKHYFLGSTAAHLVRSAPCPVLVVREHERGFVG